MPTPLRIPADNPFAAAAAPTLTSPRSAPRERTGSFERTLADAAKASPRHDETRSKAAEAESRRRAENETDRAAPDSGRDDAAVAATPASDAADAPPSATAADGDATPTPLSARPDAQPAAPPAQSLPNADAAPRAADLPSQANQANHANQASHANQVHQVNQANLGAGPATTAQPSSTGAASAVRSLADASNAGGTSAGPAAPSPASSGAVAPGAAATPDQAATPPVGSAPSVATQRADGAGRDASDARPAETLRPGSSTGPTPGDTGSRAASPVNPVPGAGASAGPEPGAGPSPNPDASAAASSAPATGSDRPAPDAAPRQPVTPDAASRVASTAPEAPSPRSTPTPAPGTTSAGAAASTVGSAPASARDAGGGDEQSTPRREGSRGSGAFRFADGPSAGLSPAAARAVQVEAAVQLANLAGAATGTEPLGPSLGATANVTSALAGGLRGETVEPLLSSSSSPSTNGAAALTSRVVRGLATMVNQHGGVMNMRLTPPELGALRVQMSIVQGTVTADFTASSEQAQAVLSRSLGLLRGALESHGLHVERLAVHVAPPADAGQGARHEGGDQANQDHAQRHSHDAAREESRGRRDGADRQPSWRRAATAGFSADLEALTAAATDLETAGASAP